jgi:ABC-type multidrug transport system fused ATPase/permease subunit
MSCQLTFLQVGAPVHDELVAACFPLLKARSFGCRHQLTAGVVFTSLALFNVLIAPLNSFPWVVNGVVEAVVSVRRLQLFLLAPEVGRSAELEPWPQCPRFFFALGKGESVYCEAHEIVGLLASLPWLFPTFLFAMASYPMP